MKRLLFSFILSFFIISMTFAGGAKLMVSIDKYEPYPAEPGSYLRVWMKVENIGNDYAKDVLLEIIPEFPFSLDPNEEPMREISSLAPGEVVIKDFKIRIDENAIEGDNDFKYKYKSDGFDWLETVEKINIQTHDAVISIKNVSAEEIAPGSEGELKISLENLADSFLKDISIKLDLNNVPVSPVKGGSEKRIYLMKSKEENEISFNLIALPDAEGGIYKVPIYISYSDTLGNKYEKNDFITLKIGSKPEITVNYLGDVYLTKGVAKKITLNVINFGLNKAKFLKLAIESNKDFEVLLPNEYYVGDLESDDFETAEFTVVAKKSGTLTLPVKISYLDVNNNKYVENQNVTIKVFTSGELKAIGLSKSNSWTWILLLIFGVIAYYFWRKRQKE